MAQDQVDDSEITEEVTKSEEQISGYEKLFCYSTYDPKTLRTVVIRLSQALTKI